MTCRIASTSRASLPRLPPPPPKEDLHNSERRRGGGEDARGGGGRTAWTLSLAVSNEIRKGGPGRAPPRPTRPVPPPPASRLLRRHSLVRRHRRDLHQPAHGVD